MWSNILNRIWCVCVYWESWLSHTHISDRAWHPGIRCLLYVREFFCLFVFRAKWLFTKVQKKGRSKHKVMTNWNLVHLDQQVKEWLLLFYYWDITVPVAYLVEGACPDGKTVIDGKCWQRKQSGKNKWTASSQRKELMGHKVQASFHGKITFRPQVYNSEKTTAQGIRVREGSFVLERIYGD